MNVLLNSRNQLGISDKTFPNLYPWQFFSVVFCGKIKFTHCKELNFSHILKKYSPQRYLHQRRSEKPQTGQSDIYEEVIITKTLVKFLFSFNNPTLHLMSLPDSRYASVSAYVHICVSFILVIVQQEELAEGLHLIDFEQLKIENQTYNEKIEERNDELLKLRKKINTTVQVLTHLKEKLQHMQVCSNTLSREVQ